MLPPDYEPLIHALRRVMRALDKSSRRLLIDHGLTGPQRTVLRVLAAKPGASSSALAEAAGVGQATVTDILDRLVARGLVSRVRSETDRRCVELALTPAAEQLLQSSPVPLPPAFVARYSALATDERTRLVENIEWLAALMDRDDEVDDVRHSG